MLRKILTPEKSFMDFWGAQESEILDVAATSAS